MKAYNKDTLTAIANVSPAELERIVREVDKYEGDFSNKLICLRRNSTGDYYATILSRFVAEKLFNAQAFANVNEKRRLLRLFTAVPQMRAARGWLFEAYAHNRFSSSSDTAAGITVYPLAPVPDASEKYRADLDSPITGLPFPLVHREVRVYNKPSDFLDNPATQTYHMPSAKNNAGLDSFLITETEAYIFQMTVSCAHAADTGSQKGLSLLEKMLPPDVPWHYVLVVPDRHSVTLTSVSKKWVDAVVSFLLLVLE